MRDDERRPAGEELAQRDLDPALGADVHGRGRLVEDEDPRVGEQRSRKRDQLALADRQAGATLAESVS